MKVSDYFSRGIVPARIANAKGRYSSQFMSGDTKNDTAVTKKNLEKSVKRGEFDGNFRKSSNRTEMNQPMAKYSEFWIG